MTLEFWTPALLRGQRRRQKEAPRKRPGSRKQRPKLPIRVGKAQQVLSSAIILGDHQLASWLDLAVKTDRVVGTPEALKELRQRLDSVMEPLREDALPPISA